MEMREVFTQELGKLMESDPRICVIDADLAKASGTINLRKRFPDRALDVGIAEQNMASIAAGMASYGFLPFITSFTQDLEEWRKKWSSQAKEQVKKSRAGVFRILSHKTSVRIFGQKLPESRTFAFERIGSKEGKRGLAFPK